MYVCICARVRECELRAAIRCGARTEEAVGDACGAGTGCGSCLDRVSDVIIDEELEQVRAGVVEAEAPPVPDTLGITRAPATT